MGHPFTVLASLALALSAAAAATPCRVRVCPTAAATGAADVASREATHLAGAQLAARELLARPECERVEVLLCTEGEHVLSQPLRLTAADSNTTFRAEADGAFRPWHHPGQRPPHPPHPAD